jgi:CheY-like chemotaxis protein
MAKVMLVEDDNNLIEIYQARLEAEGYTIVTAHDGEEALALAVKERPDLIISDVMMPKISGFDMLDILRSTTETKNTKVIMMTALSQAEDKTRADKLGADRYLVKSQVTLEDVVRVAREVLGTESATTTAPATTASAQPASSTPTPVIPVVAAPTPSEPPAATAPTPPVAMAPDISPPSSPMPTPQTPPSVDSTAAVTPVTTAEPTTAPIPSTDITSIAPEPVVSSSPSTSTPIPVTVDEPDLVLDSTTSSPTTESSAAAPAQAKLDQLPDSQTTEAEAKRVEAQINGFIANNDQAKLDNIGSTPDKTAEPINPDVTPPPTSSKPIIEPTTAPPAETLPPEPVVVAPSPAPQTPVAEPVAETTKPVTEPTPTPPATPPTPTPVPQPDVQPMNPQATAPINQVDQPRRAKVLQPLNDTFGKGPDLDALLAKEEALSPAPAPAADQVISPNDTTMPAAVAPTVEPPSHMPGQTVDPANGGPGTTFDPNSIAL